MRAKKPDHIGLPFAAMDYPGGPEEVSESPVYCATDTNASFLTTDEKIQKTDIQTPLQDIENIMEMQSNENAAVSTSDSSGDTDEVISVTLHGCDKICSSVNSQDSQFSPPLEASSDFDMSSESRNHPSPNNTVIVVHTHERKESVIVSSAKRKNRKRSLSNDRMTSESNLDHKRSKPEIFVRSGKDISTDSEQDTNKDNTLKLNATSQISVDNSALAGIDDQNIESISYISETDQDYNASSKISALIASEGESVCSLDDCLAMPGPSGLPENNNTSNLCGETFQSFTCRVCKVAIAEHATEENTFQCCNCSYTNCEEVDVQIHSYTHVSETTCNICLNKHQAGNLHNSKHRCPECRKTIRCRTQLYEHFLEHREYLKRNCYVCSRTFKEHITENYAFYVCCVCGFQSEHLGSIIRHNVFHLPRFYCRLCEEEYSAEEKRLHGGEFTCFECPEKFKCQTQVEAHYEDKHKNYSENCKICKRSINEHFIGPDEAKKYQCCKNDCLQTFLGRRSLQDHLYSHTGLRVLKCTTCGRRFNQRTGLSGHSRQCKELPFKCGICEIRFHSSDILREQITVRLEYRIQYKPYR